MKLSINELSFLAGTYMEKTPLSLFANIGAKPDGTEKQSLAMKGVLVDGIIAPQAREMLDIAAGAGRCTRIALKDNYCVVEKFVYMMDDKKLLVENDGGDLLFSLPAGWSKTLSELSEFTGISRIKSSSVEILLPVEQMMTLLAVIDLSRKNALLSYIGNDIESQAVAYKDIVRHLENPGSNSFVSMLKRNYNFAVPDGEKVGALLSELSVKGCIRFEKGCVLQGDYAVFANSFLIPETVVIMEVFNSDKSGKITTGAALCICAGVKDIASFVFSSDGIEFSSISGMQLMQMVENFLDCPDISGQ